MTSPISLPVPVSGLLPANPAAVRPGAGADRAPVTEPGQLPRPPSETADDPRRVPPPPRIEASRPEEALRGDRADTADPRSNARPGPGAGGAQGFDPGGFRDRGFGPQVFEEIRAGRIRPRPSSPFLAQIIGQALDRESGAASGGSARGPRDVADLYRQTRDTVDRALFRGPAAPGADTDVTL